MNIQHIRNIESSDIETLTNTLARPHEICEQIIPLAPVIQGLVIQNKI